MRIFSDSPEKKPTYAQSDTAANDIHRCVCSDYDVHGNDFINHNVADLRTPGKRVFRFDRVMWLDKKKTLQIGSTRIRGKYTMLCSAVSVGIASLFESPGNNRTSFKPKRTASTSFGCFNRISYHKTFVKTMFSYLYFELVIRSYNVLFV